MLLVIKKFIVKKTLSPGKFHHLTINYEEFLKFCVMLKVK